jgi:hypothetical protein
MISTTDAKYYQVDTGEHQHSVAVLLCEEGVDSFLALSKAFHN